MPNTKPKLKIVKITLEEFKKNPALQERIKFITQRRECFPNVSDKGFDLAAYEKGHILLLRNLSLTEDPNNPNNIVGYNFLSEGQFIHPDTGEICTVIKTGPVAVMNPDYPQEPGAQTPPPSPGGTIPAGPYAGSNFAAATTSSFTLRTFIKTKIIGALGKVANFFFGRCGVKIRSPRVFALGALVNPKMRGIFDVLALHATTDEEAKAITHLMQAMVPAIYPAHVNPAEFVYDGAFFSGWNAYGVLPLATPQVIEVTLRSLSTAKKISKREIPVDPHDFKNNAQEALKKYLRCLFSMGKKEYPILNFLSDKAIEYLKGDPKIIFTVQDILDERAALIKILGDVVKRTSEFALSFEQNAIIQNFIIDLQQSGAVNAAPAALQKTQPLLGVTLDIDEMDRIDIAASTSQRTPLLPRRAAGNRYGFQQTWGLPSPTNSAPQSIPFAQPAQSIQLKV